MSETEPRFYRSPVDYEAWRNGYMPPSEHILIDALHRGTAKVSSSFRSSDDGVGWWLVFQNTEGGISSKRAAVIKQLLAMDLETMVEKFDAIMAQKLEPSPSPSQE
jgi:hypothetical protein